MTRIAVRRLGSDEWELNKRVRLDALRDAPYAFTTTVEEAQRRSDADWQRLTRERAAGPDAIQLVAFVDETPAGTAACVVDLADAAAEMFAVWVAPPFRRMGVGEALVEAARSHSLGRGARRLKVGVYEDNHGALRFYRALGFADLGQTKPELAREGRAVLVLEAAL